MNKHIYLIGDIHGSFKPIRDLSQRAIKIHKDAAAGDENILIILGDAGLNFFFNRRDEELKKKLSKYPFTYFIIRGNHEERPSICAAKNPDKWHKETYFDGEVWVENDYPYIKYAMDYVCQYNINGYNTLVIPGAYSVDKYKRLEMDWSWFPKEQLSEDEMIAGKELLNQMNWKCDLVLSHTCPIMFEPTDLFLSFVDQSMVDKTMERYLGEIEFNLDYTAWCWGHYHKYRDYPRDDGRRKLMLFNDYAVELTDFMKSEVPTKI